MAKARKLLSLLAFFWLRGSATSFACCSAVRPDHADAIYVFDDRQREFHLRATYGRIRSMH
jgi:hypothetical protein